MRLLGDISFTFPIRASAENRAAAWISRQRPKHPTCMRIRQRIDIALQELEALGFHIGEFKVTHRFMTVKVNGRRLSFPAVYQLAERELGQREDLAIRFRKKQRAPAEVEAGPDLHLSEMTNNGS